MPVYYYITADGVGTLNIDSTMFDLTLPGISRQYQAVSQFANNARISGNGGLTPGMITMTARNRAGTSNTAFNSARLSLMSFIAAARTSNMIFHIVNADGVTEYTVPVVPVTSGAERYSNLRVSEQFQLSFQCLNGYYTSTTMITHTNTLTTTPENITVTYSGVVPVYPTISYTPSADITLFQIERSDNYGLRIETDIAAGTELILQLSDGTIYLAGSQIGGVQTGGSTFQLLPGDNTLTVNAGAGSLILSYYDRIV